MARELHHPVISFFFFFLAALLNPLGKIKLIYPCIFRLYLNIGVLSGRELASCRGAPEPPLLETETLPYFDHPTPSFPRSLTHRHLPFLLHI